MGEGQGEGEREREREREREEGRDGGKVYLLILQSISGTHFHNLHSLGQTTAGQHSHLNTPHKHMLAST